MSLWIPTALVVAALMERWAAFLHGRFWHAVLWPVHRSHHEPRAGRFERNDLLALFHAPIAIALIVWGAPGRSHMQDLAFGVGLGMTLFAVGYLVVHDGLVHGRLPVAFLLRWKPMRGIVRAHQIHHRTGAAPYGLFLGVTELATHRRKARSRSVKRQRATAPPDQDQAR